MLQLADRINREDGLDALRSWLEEVRPRCQLETGAVVVNVVELDEKQAPHPRKTIIGLRSDAWEGTRYGFREDLE